MHCIFCNYFGLHEIAHMDLNQLCPFPHKNNQRSIAVFMVPIRARTCHLGP